MEELLLALKVAGFTILANVIYLLVNFGKNYHNFLLNELKDLASKLNYNIIEDKEINSSLFHLNVLTIGNDILSSYDISKITTIYLSILDSNTNNITISRFTNYVYQFSKYTAILFSIGLLIEFWGVDIGILVISILLIATGLTITLILCCVSFSTYKKLLQSHSFIDLRFQKVYLSLYWYLPIIILNASIGIIQHIRWLFSKT